MEAVTEIAAGSASVTVAVPSQLLRSITVTAYVPGSKFTSVSDAPALGFVPLNPPGPDQVY